MIHSLSYPVDPNIGPTDRSSRVHSLERSLDHNGQDHGPQMSSRVSGHHNGFSSLFSGHGNGHGNGREGIGHTGYSKKYSQAKRRSIIGLDAGKRLFLFLPFSFFSPLSIIFWFIAFFSLFLSFCLREKISR